jgi:hypothetical protein
MRLSDHAGPDGGVGGLVDEDQAAGLPVLLHRGPRPLPERVSDGCVFDPQGGVRGLRRGGQVAVQGTLPPRRARAAWS